MSFSYYGLKKISDTLRELGETVCNHWAHKLPDEYTYVYSGKNHFVTEGY